MVEQGKCPQCGKAVPSDTPQGLCPACLLRRGLETNTIGDTGGAAGARWTPPAVEELAPLFPELDIIELIGRGGMGAVYKAREKQLDRLVALKVLPPEIGREDSLAKMAKDFAKRFAHEAQAMAKLSHPNIVTIYSFGSRAMGTGTGETAPPEPVPVLLYFFIMEYVDGLSLRQLLDRGTISPKEALAIVPQICDALQYAHDRGIVHRDIKPENILLSRAGQVKIADFGLAKLVGLTAAGAGGPGATGAEAGSPGAPGVTQAGEKVMGTPQYMAPEQIDRPREVDHRADIYSLGVVFYQMLTGELPVGRFEPPSHKVLIDVRLDEVVLRALQREPSRRYQQVSEVKTRVETIVATVDAGVPPTRGQTVSASQVTVKYPDVRILMVGVVSVMAVLVSMYFALMSHSSGLQLFVLGCILPAILLITTLVAVALKPRKNGGNLPRPLAPPPIGNGNHCESARQAVKAPAIGLMVAAGINLAVVMAPAIIGVVWSRLFWWQILLILLGLLINVPILWAAMRMMSLRNRGWAITAAILALIAAPANLIGLPFGIWALVVLRRREVIEAFPANRAGQPAARRASLVPALWAIMIHAVVFGAILAVLVFVVPKCEATFRDMGMKLSQLTRATIAASHIACEWSFVVFPMFLLLDACVCLPLQYFAGQRARRWWSAILALMAAVMITTLGLGVGLPYARMTQTLVRSADTSSPTSKASQVDASGSARPADPRPAGQFPSASHFGSDQRSVYLVHDGRDVHYVFFHRGRFTSSTSGSQNAHSFTWIDKGSLKLASGRTFGFLRESVDPVHLSVNGKEFDLRQGRVLILHEDGSMEQIKLFPTMAVARSVDALAKAVDSATEAQPTACPLEALVYEVRVPADKIAQFDANALAAAAGPAELEKALSAAGQTRLLYRMDQSVRLSGEQIGVQSGTPMVFMSRLSELGGTINTVQYTSVGVILKFAGKAVAGGIDATLDMEMTALAGDPTVPLIGSGSSVMLPPRPTTRPARPTTRPATTTTRPARSTTRPASPSDPRPARTAFPASGMMGAGSVIRKPRLSHKGLVQPGKPVVMLGVSGTPDANGLAVAYVARIVLGSPRAIFPPADEADAPTCPLDATVFELRLPPGRLGQFSPAALGNPGSPAEFAKALARFGQAKTLYRMDQSVRLSGDRIRIDDTVPVATSVRPGPSRSSSVITTVDNRSVGAKLTVSGSPRPGGAISAAINLELSTMSDSQVNITETLAAKVWRTLLMACAGESRPGEPIVIATGDGASLDANGQAVAYFARIVLGKPAAATQPASAKAVADEFYVMGEVERPGAYPLAGREITVKMALAGAGFALGKKKDLAVVLIRRLHDGSEQQVVLSIDALMAGDQQDVLLRNGDVVAVRPVKEVPGRAATQPASQLEVWRLREEIWALEQAIETETYTRHRTEKHPAIMALRERIASARERLAKASAPASQPATQTAISSAKGKDPEVVTELALSVLRAIKEDDLATLKSLSAGSQQGWLEVDWRTPMSQGKLNLVGEPPVGWSESNLKSVTAEIRRDVLLRNPDAATKVLQTLVQDDLAAALSPVTSSQYLVMVFVKTDGGWRFATLDQSKGNLADDLAKHMANIPKNLKVLRQLDHSSASQPATQPALYDWQRTDKYVAPDFDAYFPDDAEGGRKLDVVFDTLMTDPRPAGELLAIVRKGLRRTTKHRTLVQAAVGSRYIWGKSPQNPQAVEIMYHAAQPSDRYGTLHYAVYYGLSVLDRKPPNVLRTLADIMMQARDNNVGRISWGCRGQTEELRTYLRPYLQSTDPRVRDLALAVDRHLSGEADYGQWRRSQDEAQARVLYGSQFPAFKKTLSKGGSEERLELLRKALSEPGLLWALDDSFVDAFTACAADRDARVRNEVAVVVGSRWIWRPGDADPNAVELMLKLSHDEDQSVRYNSVYYGLSVVRPRDERVIARLREMLASGRDRNSSGRIEWGLKMAGATTSNPATPR